MSYNSLEEKSSYHKNGWWLIRFSVLTMVIFLVDYKIQLIFKISSLSELGTLIGGVSGVLASIASLLFILDNLRLQRVTLEIQQQTLITQQNDLRENIEENRKSNSHYENQTIITQKQQNEASFFNLLQYNNNLKLSSEFNDAYYDEIRKQLFSKTIDYRTKAKAELIFLTVAETQLNPIYYFRTDSNLLSKSESIYNNISNMISFIEKNFNETDKDFFHSVLYNNLSINEKIILGMCVDYDIYPKKILTKFDYKLDFNKNIKYYKYNESFVPVLLYVPKDIQTNNRILSPFATRNLELNISKLIPLKKDFSFTYYELKASAHNTGIDSLNFDRRYIKNENLADGNILLIPYDEAILEIFNKGVKNENGILQFKIHFKYGDKSFLVFHTYNYSIDWNFKNNTLKGISLSFSDDRPSRILI